MNRILKIGGVLVALCVLIPYIWWTGLSLTFDPDKKLHPVNLWFVTQAHHAMAPIGDFFGYDDAAEAVRLMYEVEPNEIVHEKGRGIGSMYYFNTTPPLGECTTFSLRWTPRDNESQLEMVKYFILDYHVIAAWYAGQYTACVKENHDGTPTLTRTARIRIGWPQESWFVLPLFPLPALLPVQEGLLHRAATNSPDINYYTRIRTYEATLNEEIVLK